MFITGLVGVTLFLANLEISFEATASSWLNSVILNAGNSAFIVSLIAIAYFIFDVTPPGRIARASRVLQSAIDPSHAARTKGSLEEFLKNYNRIEVELEDACKPYQMTTREHLKRISNSRLAELLLQNERINWQLYGKLKNLITLRNSIIHGAEPNVSQQMVITSSDTLNELKITLRPNQGE